MVKDEYFPVEVKNRVIVIDTKNMKLNEIYCVDCKGDSYQIELEKDGIITILKEFKP